MINILKKNDFPLRIERLFTSAVSDPFVLVHFRQTDATTDEPGFEAPDNWSTEASAAFSAEAACLSIPETTKSIEENTVPSWLWQRSSETGTQTQETSVQKIFHRAAGASTYTGWKQGVFADEDEARAFFDEVRYLLAQRFIALEPGMLASFGLDWAYGIKGITPARETLKDARSFEAVDFGKKDGTGTIDIRNTSIDALLAGDEKTGRKWRKLLETGTKTGFVALRFADIANDWNAALPLPPRAAIDLLAFRRAEGGIDIDRLAHAVRLLSIMLQLQDSENSTIGFHNLSPLLMSEALAYDSNAGRATAAALAAIVTSEVCIASAQLAALLGPSLDFTAKHENILRALRNHRRAVYGDRSDYEKVSVLPAPLMFDPGADLALIAAARHRWDEALELVRQHGLRATRFTELTLSAALTFFMESTASGFAPMPTLDIARAVEDDLYRRELHPAVMQALAKLGYDNNERTAISAYIAGSHTLVNAPAIDHAVLRRKGFTNETLELIENYLPYANEIRLAFTPWVLGEEFYHDILEIPADKIRDPHFDLLRHLGFTTADIAAADAFCYGFGTARGAPGLKPLHAAIFAQASEMPAEAQIRMAASVQAFISGDTGLVLSLTPSASAEEIARLLLGAWRQGVRSATVEFEITQEPEKEKPSAAAIQLQDRVPPPVSATQNYTTPLHSTLRSKSKAKGKLVSLKQGTDKPARPAKH